LTQGLTKKTKPAPIKTWCEKCQKPFERYIIYEGGPDDPPKIAEFHCHGDIISWGVSDVPGFEAMLDRYRNGTTAVLTLWKPEG